MSDLLEQKIPTFLWVSLGISCLRCRQAPVDTTKSVGCPYFEQRRDAEKPESGLRRIGFG